MSKDRLSKAQAEVVRLMRSGWELGKTRHNLNVRVWMQKGGLGYGGPAKDIAFSTFWVLLKKKIVESCGDNFPTEHYRLVEAKPE